MFLLQSTEIPKDSEMAVHVFQCSNKGKAKQVHFMAKHPYYLEDRKSEQLKVLSYVNPLNPVQQSLQAIREDDQLWRNLL